MLFLLNLKTFLSSKCSFSVALETAQLLGDPRLPPSEKLMGASSKNLVTEFLMLFRSDRRTVMEDSFLWGTSSEFLGIGLIYLGFDLISTRQFRFCGDRGEGGDIPPGRKGWGLCEFGVVLIVYKLLNVNKKVDEFQLRIRPKFFPNIESQFFSFNECEMVLRKSMLTSWFIVADWLNIQNF